MRLQTNGESQPGESNSGHPLTGRRLDPSRNGWRVDAADEAAHQGKLFDGNPGAFGPRSRRRRRTRVGRGGNGWSGNPRAAARRVAGVARGIRTRTSRLEACAAAVTSEPRSSRWRDSNPRSRHGAPVCRHNTSPAGAAGGPAASCAGADGGNRTRDAGVGFRRVATTLHLRSRPSKNWMPVRASAPPSGASIRSLRPRCKPRRDLRRHEPGRWWSSDRLGRGPRRGRDPGGGGFRENSRETLPSVPSRWRESNPRSRSGEPVCHHNTSPAAVGPRPWTRVLAGARASWGTRGTCRVTATVGRTSRRGARIVGRVGIEPTSGRFKKPLQGQHLLPTHRPTLWDRTRTSWASARRADRLRKSGREPGDTAIGNRGRRLGEPAGRARWLDLGAL